MAVSATSNPTKNAKTTKKEFLYDILALNSVVNYLFSSFVNPLFHSFLYTVFYDSGVKLNNELFFRAFALFLVKSLGVF